MTDAEKELEAMSAALAAAASSPWSPDCVAEAFLGSSLVIGPWSLGPFTLGGWLRLERDRSPFVTGIWPDDSAEVRVAALAGALGVLVEDSGFGKRDSSGIMEILSPEEALQAESMVYQRINEAFRTALPMHNPDASKPKDLGDDGMGWWLKVFTKLVGELHLRPAEALALPMAQAFALVAAQSALDGCVPKGMNWREREALEKAEAEKKSLTQRGDGERRGDNPKSEIRKPQSEGSAVAPVGEVVVGDIGVAERTDEHDQGTQDDAAKDNVNHE